MTKADLIAQIQQDILNSDSTFKKKEISYKIISTIINSLFEVMKDNIAEGKHIELRGFGTFETKIRQPKKAINPRTKEIVEVKKHAVPIFRPGKELKKLVRDYFDKHLS
jgi:DNA-binding protein HU-beta